MNNARKAALAIVAIMLALAITGWLLNQRLFAAPQKKAPVEELVVSKNVSDSDELIALLMNKGFIKSEYGFRIAFFSAMGAGRPLRGVMSRVVCVDCFSAGAFKLSKSMDAWELAKAVTGKPYMEWVVLPEGWRKEQMAEALAAKLGWSDAEKIDWTTKLTALDNDHIEGVYFPDTYLIPTDETPAATAERLRKRFEEKFAPYSQEALKQNVKWTTLLKIASLIQREAGGKGDMPIISGVIWNRLLSNKRLEIDATIQYIVDTDDNYDDNGYVGESGRANGWWRPIKGADIRAAKSPYNTYLNSGLPPRPICNPGLDAIKAALYPAQTECLFYLHDPSGNIHCAKTYEGHLANIEKYLK